MVISFVGGAADRARADPSGRAGVAARARDRHDRHVPRDQLDRAGAVRQRHQAAAARVPEQDVAARQRADLERHARARRRARSPSAWCSTCCFNRTRIGLAFRAVASNPESSRLVGVPVGRMLMLGWAMAAAIGALAGALVIAPVGLQGASMQEILVYSFAAAALGGFDSPLGAVVGGPDRRCRRHDDDAVPARRARHRARRAVRAHPDRVAGAPVGALRLRPGWSACEPRPVRRNVAARRRGRVVVWSARPTSSAGTSRSSTSRRRRTSGPRRSTSASRRWASTS